MSLGAVTAEMNEQTKLSIPTCVFPFVFVFLLCRTAPASAAAKPEIPPPGKFLSAAPVSLQDAQSKCAVDPGAKIDGANGGCKVLTFKLLGSIGKEFLSFGWYGRAGKVQTEQLVLFSAPNEQGPLTPIWTDVVEVYDSSGPVTDVKLRRGELGDFLELKYFSGGTAGAWSELFRYEGGKWIYLQQAIDDDAAKCLPKGYGIQSKSLDIEQSKVEVFAPTADDPNCCPSGRIHLNLALKGNTLHGMNCRFEKTAREKAQ